jgi:hypothetical protein
VGLLGDFVLEVGPGGVRGEGEGCHALWPADAEAD